MVNFGSSLYFIIKYLIKSEIDLIYKVMWFYLNYFFLLLLSYEAYIFYIVCFCHFSS